MALTYAESNKLMNDQDFRGRVKVSVLHYATYIMDEDGATPAHNVRMKWAGDTMRQPDMVATQIHPPTVMDSSVQDVGAAITDEALQAAVEKVVNKLL